MNFVKNILTLCIPRKDALCVNLNGTELKYKIVCGLHCEANLRVIPGAANIAKGNKHWPDMPGI